MCLDAIQIERPGKECEHMNFERKSKFLLEKLALFDVGIGPKPENMKKVIRIMVSKLDISLALVTVSSNLAPRSNSEAHTIFPVSKTINTWIEDD